MTLAALAACGAAAPGLLDVAVAADVSHRAPPPPPLLAGARARAPRRPGRVQHVVHHALDQPPVAAATAPAEASRRGRRLAVRARRGDAAPASLPVPVPVPVPGPARPALRQPGGAAVVRFPALPPAALQALSVARPPRRPRPVEPAQQAVRLLLHGLQAGSFLPPAAAAAV
ncbi:MAG: hypothetical protein KAG66_04350, partial [Methylococcales bacterium]|nr:hypothetical protein [Methylococcales bacterium]